MTFFQSAGLSGQETLGWADYSDNGTETMPISMVADTFSTLTNDALGSSTITAYSNGLNLWDSNNSKLDLSGLRVGDIVDVRADFKVTPTVNNTKLEFRLNFSAFGGFVLLVPQGSLDNGAGIEYQRVVQIAFYIGSQDIIDGNVTLEAMCGSDASIKVNGFFIQARR